ncbi:hypothetical protein [Neolewinella persica]|uniref:hypothetical protein n=1 Tax=Neolewinella persica TaxID=70998 RepID=UPI000369B60A|nr:hypothetical protein [Neolewinella persica]
MNIQSLPKLGRRPVFIANFGGSGRASPESEVAMISKGAEIASTSNKKGIRYNFPTAGEVVEGGSSADGYCYRVIFAAGRLERSFEMVKAFLEEQGYGELPLPRDAEELRQFRLPPKLRHQLSLFGDNGYVHNPVKILFPVPAGRQGALILELYDEGHQNHLLRFHRMK